MLFFALLHSFLLKRGKEEEEKERDINQLAVFFRKNN
jgi:hypothetical protein